MPTDIVNEPVPFPEVKCYQSGIFITMRPMKSKINLKMKKWFSCIMQFSYLRSRGLMAKTPDFHPENWGSNPAERRRVLHFLPQFINFQKVLWLSASNRTPKSEKNKGQSIPEPSCLMRGAASSTSHFSLFCAVNLNKFIIKWLNINLF